MYYRDGHTLELTTAKVIAGNSHAANDLPLVLLRVISLHGFSYFRANPSTCRRTGKTRLQICAEESVTTCRSSHHLFGQIFLKHYLIQYIFCILLRFTNQCMLFMFIFYAASRIVRKPFLTLHLQTATSLHYVCE